ncbi:trypsin-like peptidase domain-containing protein [Verrucomicrobiales bacterium]|jgi:regulator of sirC expression with transglutaminase-like and TPR domain|nr:trypsin-like peptidase domain-containing protein [bacterium]MDB4772911.1 trypsin-like peptidase domain-containing protein [Verrucomicrobiales bacterium]MDB4627034.1 trypsin-like peptidase domain-containing protein [bacterium]MDC0313085.1 trypsin-like peptidase domain-containing protein [Verrucomicrobiales bacterium]MDC0503326.1 trypsin-like peptidase domain-containing protein [Verrucomicrobiales bacterium]
MVRYRFIALFIVSFGLNSYANEEDKTSEVIAREVRPSLVTITHDSRPGRADREGSGFFVKKGLIATNLHVIGEARRIRVTTSDGKELTVKSIHASDRKLDLALIRVTEEDVPTLPLGNSDNIPDGLSVVAMGNPQGFRFSVVEGVVSATRAMEGYSMIQLAIPIEPGNSGGPLLNRQGQVIGIPSLKSQVSDNIGFAMPVNALKLLLESPNPIPIERWVTVGKLNPRQWKPLQEGADWRQRAGTISVNGKAAGFGGRSLCLYQAPPNETAFDVQVKVRLDDEAGAAGLAFASDGGDRHYGFYPSGGQLRLTHFAGPDVFSWNILADVPVPSYRQGEWNHLRVVVNGATITGYVNGDEVVSVEHEALRGGQVGLCKFRDTAASFQAFSLGEAGAVEQIDPALNEALNQWLKEPNEDSVSTLESTPKIAKALIEEKARAFEIQAENLRNWSLDLHRQHVIQETKRLLENKKDHEIDLFHTGLLIALLNDPDLNVEAYRKELDSMAEEIRSSLKENANATEKLASLSDYLFQQLGFHGSRSDYYARDNSYLNVVLEDREGIPITLSVLYMELAQRLEVTGLHGIPLPGHFVLQHRSGEGKNQLIDVFDGGKLLTTEDAENLVLATTGRDLNETDLDPAGKRSILTRMLRNLIGIDLDSEDPTQAIPELDLLLAIDPEDASSHLSRALLLYQSNAGQRAIADIEWLLEKQPPGIHLDRLHELRDRILR